jgi:hypothetical protein
MGRAQVDEAAGLTLPETIPLFPLPDVVLFPLMPLPLHVFEPRYRTLVQDVVEGQRVIGISLLRPGWQADYEGRPPIYEVGCAGRLEGCQPLRDGRYDIVLRGLIRFRVLEEQTGKPYRLARVEPRPDVVERAEALERARRELLEAVARASDALSVLVLKNELPHGIFVNALCQSLPLAPVERQSLLDCGSILARCERLREILDFKVLEKTHGHGGDGPAH